GLASRSAAERFPALLERRPAGVGAADLPILLGVPAPEAAGLARAEPAARQVGDLWVQAVTLGEIAARALATLKAYHRAFARERLIAPAALRDRLGISRKFMIPLLEWADAKGITERVGDARRLRNA